MFGLDEGCTRIVTPVLSAAGVGLARRSQAQTQSSATESMARPGRQSAVGRWTAVVSRVLRRPEARGVVVGGVFFVVLSRMVGTVAATDLKHETRVSPAISDKVKEV